MLENDGEEEYNVFADGVERQNDSEDPSLLCRSNARLFVNYVETCNMGYHSALRVFHMVYNVTGGNIPDNLRNTVWGYVQTKMFKTINNP